MFCSVFCTEKCTAVHVGLVRSVLINTTLSKAPDAEERVLHDIKESAAGMPRSAQPYFGTLFRPEDYAQNATREA